MLLQRLHFFGGISFLLVFIYSGGYMDTNYNHLEGMEDIQRMIFRAEHIYLLLSSLIHIAMGTYFAPFTQKYLRYFQILASVLMFTASLLFILSFFKEMPTDIIERSLSRNGLYLMLAGVVLHGIVSLIAKKVEQPASENL